MNNETKIKDERTINVYSLMIRLALRWKIILLAAIVIGLLGAGLKYYKSKKSVDSLNNQSSAVAVDSNPQANDYSYLTSLIDNELAIKQEYVANTMLSKINPKRQPTTTLSYIVSNNYLNREPDAYSSQEIVYSSLLSKEIEYTATCARLFSILIYNTIDYNDLMQELGLQSIEYVKELIFLSDAGDVITVTVVADTEENSKKIADYLTPYIEQELVKISDFMPYITIKKYSEQTTVLTNNSRNGWINDQVAHINSLLNNKNTLENYKKSSISSNSTPKIPSKKELLKTFIKYGIVGFALSVFLLAAKLVIPGYVLSAQEFSKQYELRNLGSVFREYKGINNIIMNFDKNYKKSRNANNIDIIKNALNSHSLNSDKTCFICDCDDSEQIIGDVFNNYNILNNVISDLDQREKIKEYDNVVLLAGIEKSKYTNFDDIIDIVNSKNKKIIGAVFM